MKVTDVEIDGKKMAIELSSSGTFSATLDGESYSADTLEKLKQKLVRSRRRAKVRIAIPATLALGSSRYNSDTESLIDVDITGIHLRNHRTILYRRLDNGKAGDTSGYSETLLKRLDAADKAKYLRLLKEKLAATTAFDKHKADQTINEEAIRKQVRDAETAAGIEPAEED